MLVKLICSILWFRACANTLNIIRSGQVVFILLTVLTAVHYVKAATIPPNETIQSEPLFPSRESVLNETSEFVFSPPRNDYEGREVDRGMRSDKDSQNERLKLLKQIKSLDHMKCFPKVLCGLSVDSSKSLKAIDSKLVKSYIQLMRSANPEDDSSEETKDKRKDAVAQFLLKSGILKPKRKSHSASSSEESDEEERNVRKSPLQLKNEAIQSLLSKRKLDHDNYWLNGSKMDDFESIKYRPVLHLSPPSGNSELSEPILGESESITSQIGSLVSSWVPWVSLSFGRESFEKDPFFKGGSTPKPSLEHQNQEKWKHDLQKLAGLIKKNKKNSERKRLRISKGRDGRDLSDMDEEIQVYSTAVEIGKKLKDRRQCDYLYNGCPVTYGDIIKIIASIRQDMKPTDEEDTIETLSREILEYSQKRKGTSTTKRPVVGLIKTRPSSNNQQQILQKQPMTQISHILPNGEKVEINVQLSAKEEEVENGGEIEIESPYDEFVPEELEKDEPEQPKPLKGNEGRPIFSSAGDDEAEPAISSSYELENEKKEEELVDYRKPTPLDIFNKVSNGKRKKQKRPTTTRSPSTAAPKYSVTKKRTTTSTTTRRPKTRRTTTTTRRPNKTKRPGTKQPMVIPRSTSPTSLLNDDEFEEEEESSEESTTTTTTTTKRPKRPSTTTQKIIKTISTTSRPAVDKSEKPKNKSRPTDISIKDSTNKATVSTFETVNKKSNKRRPTTTTATTKRTTSTTTEEPIFETLEQEQEQPSIIIQVDKSPQEEEGENSSEEDFYKTTKRPIKFPTTSTTFGPTTTLPALAVFTKSYIDEVIENMQKTAQPPTPKPSGSKYQLNNGGKKRKNKPAAVAEDNYYTRPGTFGIGNSTGDQDHIFFAASLESSEVNPFIMAQVGTHWNNEGEVDETTKAPNQGESANNAGKKKISYKNPKRPYLILMSTAKPVTSKRKSPKPNRDNTKPETFSADQKHAQSDTGYYPPYLPGQSSDIFGQK